MLPSQRLLKRCPGPQINPENPTVLVDTTASFSGYTYLEITTLVSAYQQIIGSNIIHYNFRRLNIALIFILLYQVIYHDS